MVELRWAERWVTFPQMVIGQARDENGITRPSNQKKVKVLQYRTMVWRSREHVPLGGSYVESKVPVNGFVGEWSDWQDVPTFKDYE